MSNNVDLYHCAQNNQAASAVVAKLKLEVQIRLAKLLLAPTTEMEPVLDTVERIYHDMKHFRENTYSEEKMEKLISLIRELNEKLSGVIEVG